MQREFILSGRRCLLQSGGKPEVLLVEPVDENDLSFLDREMAYLQAHSPVPFALVTFLITEWNRELTPWPAEAVFGKEPFGDGAGETLAFVTDRLIPYLEMPGLPVVVGGYSLAAFFALWAGYASDRFAGVAAASPSVWYPGWMGFARSNRPHAGSIALSLGDTEERTRVKAMKVVGECIREQAALLEEQGVKNALEWNPGNHFQDTDIRTAKAFVTALRLLRG